jgi:hypothetical protein
MVDARRESDFRGFERVVRREVDGQEEHAAPVRTES